MDATKGGLRVGLLQIHDNMTANSLDAPEDCVLRTITFASKGLSPVETR